MPMLQLSTKICAVISAKLLVLADLQKKKGVSQYRQNKEIHADLGAPFPLLS